MRGRTSGLIEAGEEVTWQARHFGLMQEFTSRITTFQRPDYFQDAMQRGAFKSFVHDHEFRLENGGTRMVDVLAFAAPAAFHGIGPSSAQLTLTVGRSHWKRSSDCRTRAGRSSGATRRPSRVGAGTSA